MRQRDRESVADSDSFGLGSLTDSDLADHDVPDPDYAGSLLDDYDSVEADEGRLTRTGRATRAPRSAHEGSSRHSRSRRRGNRRFFAILAVLLVLVVGVSAWLIVVPIYHYLNPSDYSGAGAGTVVVTVHADDGAEQIGTTLHEREVVASVRAFTDAASANSGAKNIQPGTYRLHRHMAASKAVTLLLSPGARVKADVLVQEGATVLDVQKRLTRPQCPSGAGANCGPGLPAADVHKALTDVRGLGLPTEYLVGGKAPRSVEGFLYPATYFFETRTSASAALQQMISKFTDTARSTGFTARAHALGITPYQELIIASLAQAEAKYAADFPKVARVILNRLAAKKPLQIDASTRYGALLDGKNPSSVVYSNYNTPYNTYLNDGLPPTPIGNPGAEALNGVGHPVSGDYLYYVNGDAAGHLVFLHTAAEFEKARHKCHVNGWGCAGP